MKFSPALLDEIRARLTVSEVVGRRVKLRKQGREFSGLSPFNPERSPSFFVNDQKGFYHDFSSGKHGDIFRFLMETEGLTFPEAVERLAEQAGVRLEGDRRPETDEQRRAREQRMSAMEREAEKRRAERNEVDRQDREKRMHRAGDVWADSSPNEGTQAEAYLIGRGMAPRFCIDPNLRFHRGLKHPFDGGTFPCLIARVQGVDGRGIGVWRIFLGNGKKGRAPVDKPKLGLGDFRDKGGAVRLGGTGPVIGIGEGIESSLAACELNGGAFPVWAALMRGGIERFIAPPGVRRVVVFEDADLWKRDKITGEWRPPAGHQSAEVLARRYAGTDVEIQIETPTLLGKGDYVDILRKLKGLPDES